MKPPEIVESSSSGYPELEFHVRREARERYAFDVRLFALNHNRLIIDFRRIQKLVDGMSSDSSDPAQMRASELYSMGLEYLIFHKVIRLYRNRVFQDLLPEAIRVVTGEIGAARLDALLAQFDQSHTVATKRPVDLESELEGVNTRQLLLEELIITWLVNQNPGADAYNPLFSDEILQKNPDYERTLHTLGVWLNTLAPFGSEQLPLLDLLQAPVRFAPYSIADQLEYIRQHWGAILGDHLKDLLRGLDMIREETKSRGLGSGEIHAPDYSNLDAEYERYSQDSEWMPKVVMIAKNTLVWLDQLSKQYKREITRLDQVPDDELDLLANRGFTALWLIGLWDRSDISRTIKHWCGNPDAESSAYSLKGYNIMWQIGGTEAYENLRNRAWQRGVRLASDMVPNHTGLDSPWLKEHPDWYVQTDQSPFPSYSFHSGDLSQDPDITIQIEDHYYSRDDAAVVFKHFDHRNGQTRYIYHGNDGTSMPWNDTAQLNYLNPEVRETIIQVILHVARQFPIIRFDAAMTLAKRHIQRLWFPEPGSGGDIPSRAQYGIRRDEFEKAIPEEFWREVVDRVAAEVPDTLLLAEAFWMMEGYFVRTLGMHRVYNSAFMNMLKMEDNAKFRGMIKSTLEYDPRILQRYVNFLSNPDEDTAVAQFGKGDKYFGVTTLMLTLPGLPMFAHAQIEGFEEKYGMEYRRAYWDESVDQGLVDRHKHEIFPIAKKRYLFAGAENFRFFDFVTDHGVNENVLAYTNRVDDERVLVLMNNAYESTSGGIRHAVTFTQPGGETIHDDLLAALNLRGAGTLFAIDEQRSGLTYLRSADDLDQHGLSASLSGYDSQVFWNFRAIEGEQWWRLKDVLAGAGTPNLERALRDLEFEPVFHAFHRLFEGSLGGNAPGVDLQGFIDGLEPFAAVIDDFLGIDTMSTILRDKRTEWQQALRDLSAHKDTKLEQPSARDQTIILALKQSMAILGELFDEADLEGRLTLQDMPVTATYATILEGHELDRKIEYAHLLPIALQRIEWMGLDKLAEALLYPCVQGFLDVNTHEGVDWYSGDQMEELMLWLPITFGGDALLKTRMKSLETAHGITNYHYRSLREHLLETND